MVYSQRTTMASATARGNYSGMGAEKGVNRPGHETIPTKAMGELRYPSTSRGRPDIIQK